MMKVFKTTNTTFDKLKRLVVKMWNGKSDTRTAIEASPYGIDSNPINDMIALYSRSELDGSEYVVGYLNKNRLAAQGEVRIFSTDANGALKFYTWLKADGTMEVGGNTDHFVRYSKLEQAFNQLKSDFNTLVTDYNSHVHPVVNAVPAAPGPVVTSPTAIIGTPSVANILPAKINEIKTL